MRIPLVAIAVIVAVFCTKGTRFVSAEEAPQYKTPDELRTGCARLVGPFTPSGYKDPDPDDARLMIVGYLDSRDPEMVSAATDLLTRAFWNGRAIRGSAFSKYTARSYPLDVRVVAVSYLLWGCDEKTWDEIREAASYTLDEYAELPVPPRSINMVFVAMVRGRGGLQSFLKSENRAIMTQRFLVLFQNSGPSERKELSNFAKKLSTELLLSEWPKLYSIQTVPAGRAALLDIAEISWKSKDRRDQQELRPIFELASKDWLLQIAERARTLLAQDK